MWVHYCSFLLSPQQTEVRESLLSASADAPESILDAIMQISVCEVSHMTSHDVITTCMVKCLLCYDM